MRSTVRQNCGKQPRLQCFESLPRQVRGNQSSWLPLPVTPSSLLLPPPLPPPRILLCSGALAGSPIRTPQRDRRFNESWLVSPYANCSLRICGRCTQPISSVSRAGRRERSRGR